MTGRDRTCDAPRFRRALYRLSYGHAKWAELESNQRPPAYQTGALPSELSVLIDAEARLPGIFQNPPAVLHRAPCAASPSSDAILTHADALRRRQPGSIHVPRTSTATLRLCYCSLPAGRVRSTREVDPLLHGRTFRVIATGSHGAWARTADRAESPLSLPRHARGHVELIRPSEIETAASRRLQRRRHLRASSSPFNHPERVAKLVTGANTTLRRLHRRVTGAGREPSIPPSPGYRQHTRVYPLTAPSTGPSFLGRS